MFFFFIPFENQCKHISSINEEEKKTTSIKRNRNKIVTTMKRFCSGSLVLGWKKKRKRHIEIQRNRTLASVRCQLQPMNIMFSCTFVSCALPSFEMHREWEMVKHYGLKNNTEYNYRNNTGFHSKWSANEWTNKFETNESNKSNAYTYTQTHTDPYIH